MAAAKTPLSSVLPPLVCGTATFNIQYNADPFALPTTAIVHKALSVGVRAFDTSPYYGPAEELLGKALDTPFVHENFPRENYFILTKVGRIASAEFDYSAEWVRFSVQRSLERLKTSYLDVVYCHDVEFVSAAEVLVAVKELRRIRDEEGTIKYVGISGYPVDVLCDLAELVLKETGEPLDVVMSYATFTLQNTTLLTEGVPRLKAAGVDVVPNASPLGMGLLRRAGVPSGAAGNWHPAPEGLREAVKKVSAFCDSKDERLEVVAIRYSLERWLLDASSVGSLGDPASGVPWVRESIEETGGRKLGVSVMGVSNLSELDECMRVWRSIIDGMEGTKPLEAAEPVVGDTKWGLERREQILALGKEIEGILGEWKDFAWDSPGKDYVNARKVTAADKA
jgi:D-arabinose 1-dehydrogenase